MRPARRIKQAEEVGRRLKALLSSCSISQLLQRTPPAALTAEQEAHLSGCFDLISLLSDDLDGATELTTQLVDAMLKQQVASCVGSLVAWVQQQPEQQRLDLAATAIAGRQGPVNRSPGSTTGPVWAAGLHVLGRFAAVAFLHIQDSAGVRNLAENLTQQLDQSGKACSCNCTAAHYASVAAIGKGCMRIRRFISSISRSLTCKQHVDAFALSGCCCRTFYPVQ
jgi:hypothetical protein